jgi:hypothetical protein
MTFRRGHPGDILRFTHTLFHPRYGLRPLLALALFHVRCLHGPKEVANGRPHTGLIRSVTPHQAKDPAHRSHGLPAC